MKSIYKKKKHSIKQIFLKAIIFVFILFSGLIISYFVNKSIYPKENKKNKSLNDEYLKNFNISFNGIIINYDEAKLYPASKGKKTIFLKIKLNTSTDFHYDVRDSLDNYFCVLDYPYAEVFFLDYFTNSCIGKECYYDGVKDVFWLKEKDHLIGGWRPDVYKTSSKKFKWMHSIPKYSKNQLIEKKEKWEKLNIKQHEGYYLVVLAKYNNKGEFELNKTELSKKSFGYKNTIEKNNYFIKKSNNKYYVCINSKYKTYNRAINIKNFGSFIDVIKVNETGRILKITENDKKY